MVICNLTQDPHVFNPEIWSWQVTRTKDINGKLIYTPGQEYSGATVSTAFVQNVRLVQTAGNVIVLAVTPLDCAPQTFLNKASIAETTLLRTTIIDNMCLFAVATCDQRISHAQLRWEKTHGRVRFEACAIYTAKDYEQLNQFVQSGLCPIPWFAPPTQAGAAPQLLP